MTEDRKKELLELWNKLWYSNWTNNEHLEILDQITDGQDMDTLLTLSAYTATHRLRRLRSQQ